VNLFESLKAVTDLPHGWTSYEKAKTLAGIILATRPACVVEIGVWSGRGLISCALACREVGYGKCYGIDPYEAAASAEGQTGENLEWWSKQNHQAMMDYCLAKIHEFQVGELASLIRERSDNVNLSEFQPSIGLLVLDGNHSMQALKDIQRFAPKIHVGGFALLDDLHWQDGGVTKSVEYLLANGFIEHFRVHKPGDDWAVFQRVKPHKEKK
jgi:cephalosporin hydroxylase